MLKVTDISKLAGLGFENTGTNASGRAIWARRVYNHENEEVYLVVNPLDGKSREKEDEIQLVLGVDIVRENIEKELEDMGSGGYSREFELPIDLIFDMIAAGVLARLDEKGAAVA